MRRVWALFGGAALLAGAFGCHHVAGVCDCAIPTNYCNSYHPGGYPGGPPVAAAPGPVPAPVPVPLPVSAPVPVRPVTFMSQASQAP
jgi:hypothetical protein